MLTCLALGVRLDLLPRDSIDGEIAGFGMSEIKSADTGRRPHRKALGQVHPDRFFGLQQVKQNSFLGVVGAGGIARARDECPGSLLRSGPRGSAVPACQYPSRISRLPVQPLGQGLGESIGEGFDHDCVVVVMLGFESTLPVHRHRFPR